MELSIRLHDWLRTFWPAPTTVDRFERMRSCAGALLGIALTGAMSYALIGNARAAAWLVAPMGASAVLLFAVPASPMAQPWSIIGGNFIAALIGITCAKLFLGAPVIAAALAVSLAIGAMFLLRCMHPPSGAMALTMVVGGPAIHAAGYSFLFVPVMLNSLLLALCAILYNNAIGRRYPHVAQAAPAENKKVGGETPFATTRLGFTPEDLDAVLKNYNQVIDISRDELQTLFVQTEMQAYRRRFGEVSCGDIMMRDINSVVFGTLLEDAWHLMQRQHLKALPVLDRGRHVIGIITATDFLTHSGFETYETFRDRLRDLLQKTGKTHTEKPEVVGQIMTKDIRTVRIDTPIINLLPLLVELELRYIPVVDDESRLVGILTQKEMVSALYDQKLVQAAA